MFVILAQPLIRSRQLGPRGPGEAPSGLRGATLIQSLQPIQDIFNMLADPDFVVENVSNNTVFVDKVAHPRYSQSEPADNIVNAGNVLVGVGEEGEGQGKASAKALVAVRAVGADADQVCSVPLDGFVRITEALRLAISAGGEVLQVEVEDDGPAGSPCGKFELRAVVAEGLEIGCCCSGLEHAPSHS